MSKHIFSLIFLFFILTLSVSGFAEKDIRGLSKNPFVMPKSFTQTTQSNSVSSARSIEANDLSLRATLTSQDDAIANVNGSMLEIGDEINGYKVIDIQIGSATLLYEGEQLMLVVNEKYKELRK